MRRTATPEQRFARATYNANSEKALMRSSRVSWMLRCHQSLSDGFEEVLCFGLSSNKVFRIATDSRYFQAARKRAIIASSSLTGCGFRISLLLLLVEADGLGQLLRCGFFMLEQLGFLLHDAVGDTIAE
eukprot:2559798-Amphidinium_carterae.2